MNLIHRFLTCFGYYDSPPILKPPPRREPPPTKESADQNCTVLESALDAAESRATTAEAELADETNMRAELKRHFYSAIEQRDQAESALSTARSALERIETMHGSLESPLGPSAIAREALKELE